MTTIVRWLACALVVGPILCARPLRAQTPLSEGDRRALGCYTIVGAGRDAVERVEMGFRLLERRVRGRGPMTFYAVEALPGEELKGSAVWSPEESRVYVLWTPDGVMLRFPQVELDAQVEGELYWSRSDEIVKVLLTHHAC